MITKKIAIISIIVFLVSIVLSGCMYLMEEDPWEHQRKMDERERIRKEQEMKKQQSTTTETNSSQQNQ
jgi:nitric oxide reductase large subunit